MKKTKLKGQAPHLWKILTPKSFFLSKNSNCQSQDFSDKTKFLPRRYEKRNLLKVSGQAMLLTVLILGSSILGASTIAGYLTLLRIRASSDTTNSTKAIFAADSGIEWELYKLKGNPAGYTEEEAHSFSNGASFNSQNDSGIIKSIGQSGNIFRAFEANIAGMPTP